MPSPLSSRLVLLVISGASLAAAAAPPEFERSELAVGLEPTSIVTADFDTDGRLDLAVANRISATISVLRGAGDGTFSFLRDVVIAGQPVSLHTADLDHNGTADLVVGNTHSNAITLLLGAGNGSFDASEAIVTDPWYPDGGGAPLAIETGDFNGDGHTDIATAIAGSNLIHVLLGAGNGTFPRVLAPAAYVFDDSVFLVARDFNHDGRLDLAVSHLDPYMAVVPGLGDGTFGHWDYFWAEPWSYQFALPSHALAAADLNEDGHLDLIRTDNSRGADTSTDGVSIHLADGIGGFLSRTRVASGANPRYITAADFNGDGHADVAVTNAATGIIALLYGDGHGNFTSRMDIATGAEPSGIATGDFNGDGAVDLAVANAAANAVSVLINRPPGCGLDTVPPVIEQAHATPSVLWPPNHQMESVRVAVTPNDACSTATCRVTSIRSSEASGVETDSVDAILTGDLTALLRSERNGRGAAGRVYHLTVTCTDGAGNASERTVTVTVPHDARGGR